VNEILHAMDVAAEQYLEFGNTGLVTQASWEEAFNKIPGICRVTLASREDPDLRELYYIRGIARNNCGYFNPGEAMELMKAARSWGVPLEELRRIAIHSRNWTRFRHDLYDVIDDYRKADEEPTK
jgi:hypothetical protein